MVLRFPHEIRGVLTTRAPSKLASDLELAGYRVFEALEVSEVLHLCEHEHIDAIVIGADVSDPDLIEVPMHETTLKLKAEATAKDLIWEFSNLFPEQGARVQ